MSIEAMKQALEALETCMYPQQKQIQAIASLRQAIEQAEKKDHAERLAEKNWQYFECPACGSEGARAFPKPMQKPEAWINWCAATGKRSVSFECESELASQPIYTNPQPCPTCESLARTVLMDQTSHDKAQHEWAWMPAPIKTQWGHDMVVADLAIDKDHTVSVYCERDQTARVEAMFNRGC